ncbi:phosphatase PAP2 family protein [candidate division KSB1 bacterium]|nr:phosphatase PAP2 family protein [candidate division KSB1 bacterium]TDJ03568.1 MAG: phosphatase PAP2 family protein [Caldithrix sp.]
MDILLWFILAAIVAYSRVVAMRHHVRDVIVGAILGIAIAFLAHQF